MCVEQSILPHFITHLPLDMVGQSIRHGNDPLIDCRQDFIRDDSTLQQLPWPDAITGAVERNC
jgi:hypothetical protein